MKMNSLPAAVQQALDEATIEMRMHPQHRLTATRRQEIYASLNVTLGTRGSQVRAWLAITAARRVLPLFPQAHVGEDDDLPPRLIELAEAVVQGKLNSDSQIVRETADLSYHIMGSDWLVSMPWPVHLAAYASRKALLEACGVDTLRYLNEHARLTIDRKRVSGNQWTDEELCTSEVGDTAAVAASADSSTSAIDQGIPECDADRLHEFWGWWLHNAILAAWDAAQEPPTTS